MAVDSETARELGRRRQAQRRIQRQEGRIQAFEDFFALGPRRSIAGLLERYREVAREHGKRAVPTLRNETIYKWAKEDNWYERAVERDRKARETAEAALTQVEVHAYQQLKELVDLSLDVIKEVLTSDDPKITPSHKLRAAELVVARIAPEVKTEGEEQAPLPPLPAPDGEVVDFEEYYRRLVQSR